jgi:hypothetical protein
MSITIDDLRALIRDQSGDLELSQGQQQRMVNILNEHRSDQHIPHQPPVGIPFTALSHARPAQKVIEQS